MKFSKSNNMLAANHSSASYLNGLYKNHSTDTNFTTRMTIWTALNPKGRSFIYDTAITYENAHVEILMTSNKLLTAKLYNDNQLIMQKRYKGKFKDGYFTLRRKVKYFGLPFLYLTSADFRFRIGKDASNKLLVDALTGRLAWIFILTGGDTEEKHSTFQPD